MSTFDNISYIATKAVKTPTGFAASNPATGEDLPGTFANNTVEHVEQACQLAEQAFVKYSRLSDKARAEFLQEIAKQIEARKEQIVERGTQETGLPEMRFNGELARTCGQLRMFANMLDEGSWVRAVIDTANPEREPLPKPDVRLTVAPMGPVVVFGASNFPLAFSTAGGDTASALAAGCPVVVKAHGSHPGTAILVAEAINEAIKVCEVPAGVFSILSSDITRIGVDMVKNDHVKAVGFTGSVGGGRALFDLCKQRSTPIPFYGELGSTNPVFLLPEQLAANTESLAKEFIGSMNMGCGQFCTNPGILVALKGEQLDAFVETATHALKDVAAQTMLSAGIHKAFEDGTAKMLEAKGVEKVVSGPQGGINQAESLVVKVDAETWLENPALEHEVFGPFNLIIECDTPDQMLGMVDRMYGHLTATLHASDNDLLQSKALVDKLRDKVGRIILNAWPTGVEVCQAMQHGGPYPAATFAPTSVGGRAIDRWVRPVAYQGMTESLLPDELKSSNPLGILRLVDGQYTRDAI